METKVKNGFTPYKANTSTLFLVPEKDAYEERNLCFATQSLAKLEFLRPGPGKESHVEKSPL